MVKVKSIRFKYYVSLKQKNEEDIWKLSLEREKLFY